MGRIDGVGDPNRVCETRPLPPDAHCFEAAQQFTLRHNKGDNTVTTLTAGNNEQLNGFLQGSSSKLVNPTIFGALLVN